MHVHSRRSRNDAMSPIKELVGQAVDLGYPALPITDHGTVGGIVELYTTANKAGIKPVPGVELYVTPDAAAGDKKSMHLTVAATTGQGYLNLVNLNNLAHQHYYRAPRVDFPLLARLSDQGLLAGLTIGTGCRSGPVVRAITERGPEAGLQVTKALASWFDHVYVELMDHNFTAEGMWDYEICEHLLWIAKEAGLPAIITTDTHYTFPSDSEDHDSLKQLTGFADDLEGRTFNGKGYWLQSENYVREVFEPEVVNACLDALSDIYERTGVKIPELDTFTLKVPDVTLTGQPYKVLADRVYADLLAVSADWPVKKQKTYSQRLDDELAVVKASDMAAYLNMVIWLTDYCLEHCIWFHTRGSATGSLILWLAKTTQEDPIAHDIRFDRFLSTDRTSPPDVDLDIEHTRREEVMAKAREHYTVLNVGTTTTYSIAGDQNEEGETKGSLRQKYFSMMNHAKADEDKIRTWREVPQEDRDTLDRLSERNLVSGRGTHPGGIVIAPDAPSVAALPMERIGSAANFVTAYDKGEVEKMGYPKIDVLGSKVLTALHIACDLIVGGDGRDWYRDIPRRDRKAIKRAGSGYTEGMFQISGFTQRRGMEKMKPKNLEEIIASMAIFRPAPMSSGFTEAYLNRREGGVVPTQHADIVAETKDTYGLAIYQEQLVGAMRRLGMSSEQLTKMLKAVKASGKAGEEAAKAAVAEELPSIKALAESKGWEPSDVDWLANTLTDYGAGYSFGKAHAVQYGVVAYKTCYLAEHEALAFWTGMLIAYTGSERVGRNGQKDKLEVVYAKAARQDGVNVYAAHVNTSGVIYAPDPETYSIRKGLTSIPGIGEKCAVELVAKRPFVSLVDLGQRVSSDVTCAHHLVFGKTPEEAGGNVNSLAVARALDGIPPGSPMRRAVGRKRKCETCKTTFSTPLEYEIHCEEEHPE